MGEAGVTAYDRLFAPRDHRLRRSPPDRRLAAWALLGAWSAVAVAHRPTEMRVTEAEEAFFGRSDDGIARFVDPQAVRVADAALATIDLDVLDDLLPYALDPHDQGTRRSVRRDPSQAGARTARKRAGIYSAINVNHRIEFGAHHGDAYPTAGPPIIVVRELGLRLHLYLMLFPGESGYSEMQTVVTSRPNIGRGLPRVIVTHADVAAAWPGLPI